MAGRERKPPRGTNETSTTLQGVAVGVSESTADFYALLEREISKDTEKYREYSRMCKNAENKVV